MSTTLKSTHSGQLQSTGKGALWLPDGSVYHLGVKKGELHPRMVTVGDHKRANALCEMLDGSKPLFTKLSSRLFLVHSGTYKGVPVSIVGIGMGAPMMDFFVREAALVLEEPMAIIRLGTCGLVNPTLTPGVTVVASRGSMYCYKNYTYFDGSPHNNDNTQQSKQPYCITAAVPPSTALTNLLIEGLQERHLPYHDGLNLAGETFYATQGRDGGMFKDDNEMLVQQFVELGVDSVEMETHQLMHLASISTLPIYTAGCAIGIVQRVNEEIKTNVEAAVLNERVLEAGAACLDALVKVVLPKQSDANETYII